MLIIQFYNVKHFKILRTKCMSQYNKNIIDALTVIDNIIHIYVY